VIVHGLGEHSGRYEHVGDRFVREGYAVYALDHRGHGQSSGTRGLVDRLDHAVSDIDSIVDVAVEEHPGLPLFVLGHSMGGALSLCYAIKHQDRLTGLILSAPLAAIDAAPPPARIAARVLSRVAPKLPLISLDSTLVSRDPEVVRVYQEDPLVHHAKYPVRTVAELTAAVDSFPEAVGSITVPVLIMYGTADRLCPPEGSVMLAQRISSPDKTVIALDGLAHEILNEPEQDHVLDEMCSWLGAHLSAVAAPD
jgi:alpha-beta hydrolase superfamily lysophospholipase